MNITHWLEAFKNHWMNHNIDGVLDLFDENVEYWETPFCKISSFKALEKEWTGIKSQEQISLTFDLFTSENGKYSVIWDLKYVMAGNKKHSAGTYLISLNESNKCVYFLQTFHST